MLVHWIWYAMLPKLSLRQKQMLLEHFSDPEDIFHTEHFTEALLSPECETALSNKDLTQAYRVIRECSEKHISILTQKDAAYPSRLKNIADPPLVLYYRGVLPDFEGQPVIAVVGTRKASAYGMNNARKISAQIAVCGGLVVSGGASGIDTMALQGALDAGQQTVAVLGCGVDVVYPKANRNLFGRIEEHGCLLSEYLPGTEPKPWQFPERNRILSGLSDGVLVVEAPEKSGALITARSAYDQGRDVFAIPGNIDIPTFMGSNALLQDCAGAVISGWDVLKGYESRYPMVKKREVPFQAGYTREESPPKLKVAQERLIPVLADHTDKKGIDNSKTSAYIDLEKVLATLEPEERKVYSCLKSEPQSVDAVIAQLGIPAGRVLSILTKLALKGVAVNHPGRLVSAKKQ